MLYVSANEKTVSLNLHRYTTVVPDDCALIMRTEAAGVTKPMLEMDITSLASDWVGLYTCESSRPVACFLRVLSR
jgi:hypothetical protein